MLDNIRRLLVEQVKREKENGQALLSSFLRGFASRYI
jgi:hypothetical protein